MGISNWCPIQEGEYLVGLQAVPTAIHGAGGFPASGLWCEHKPRPEGGTEFSNYPGFLLLLLLVPA